MCGVTRAWVSLRWKIAKGPPDALLAEQLAVVAPMPVPAQVHVQGPLPLTAEAVPAAQRFAVGAAERV